MNAFWKWLRTALPVAALAVMTTAALLIVDPPEHPAMGWLLWMTLFVSIFASVGGAGAGRCPTRRWFAGR